MKTLYVTRGNNILVDNETKECSKMTEERQGIDAIYVAKEPMHVVYGYNNENENVDVEPGDIILKFYVEDFKKKIVVVKNQDWVSNIEAYNKKMQEQKERWASSKHDESEAISR